MVPGLILRASERQRELETTFGNKVQLEECEDSTGIKDKRRKRIGGKNKVLARMKMVT